MATNDDKQNEQESMPVRHELPGYWALDPSGRKKVDDMLRGLIKARSAGKAVKEDEGPIQ